MAEVDFAQLDERLSLTEVLRPSPASGGREGAGPLAAPLVVPPPPPPPAPAEVWNPDITQVRRIDDVPRDEPLDLWADLQRSIVRSAGIDQFWNGVPVDERTVQVRRRRGPSEPPRLDGYDYVRVLGTGGLSTIYLYRQNWPRRFVAVKCAVPSAESFGHRMFERESDLQVAVAHPGLVEVLGRGRAADGTDYIIEEFCPRLDLGTWSRHGPLEVGDVLSLGITLADALDAMHQAGVLHRDIKPSNVFVRTDGSVALGDFGAAVRGGDSDQWPIVMSLPWASPEVVHQTTAGTVRSEIWSLGATLYTLLAGRSPFASPDASQNTRALVTARITDARYTPIDRVDVPASLDALIARTLSKHSEDRPASMGEVSAALSALVSSLGTRPRRLVPADGAGAAGRVAESMQVEREEHRQGWMTRARTAGLRALERYRMDGGTEVTPEHRLLAEWCLEGKEWLAAEGLLGECVRAEDAPDVLALDFVRMSIARRKAGWWKLSFDSLWVALGFAERVDAVTREATEWYAKLGLAHEAYYEGRFAEALDHAQTALAIYDGHDNRPSAAVLELLERTIGDVASAVRELLEVSGLIKRELGSVTDAVRDLTRAYELAVSAGAHDAEIARFAREAGFTLLRQGSDPVAARRWLANAGRRFQRSGRDSEAAACIVAIGEAYADVGLVDDAIRLLERVRRTLDRYGDTDRWASATLALAKVVGDDGTKEGLYAAVLGRADPGSAEHRAAEVELACIRIAKRGDLTAESVLAEDFERYRSRGRLAEAAHADVRRARALALAAERAERESGPTTRTRRLRRRAADVALCAAILLQSSRLDLENAVSRRAWLATVVAEAREVALDLVAQTGDDELLADAILELRASGPYRVVASGSAAAPGRPTGDLAEPEPLALLAGAVDRVRASAGLAVERGPFVLAPRGTIALADQIAAVRQRYGVSVRLPLAVSVGDYTWPAGAGSALRGPTR